MRYVKRKETRLEIHCRLQLIRGERTCWVSGPMERRSINGNRDRLGAEGTINDIRLPPTGQSLDRGLTRVTSSIVQVASRFLQIIPSPAPPHYIVSILPPPILEIQLGQGAYSEVAFSRSSFSQLIDSIYDFTLALFHYYLDTPIGDKRHNMTSHEHLRGSCQCGRNQYQIRLPDDITDHAHVYLDTGRDNRTSHFT